MLETMPTTRRNGQLWSCEPCRKSKLRCDHTTPVCGRCVRRNKEHLCVYHPAPLTTNASPRGKRRKQKIPLSVGSSNETDDWSQKKASVSTPGFLGQTSYFDVFADGENGLQIGGPSSSPDSVSVNLERIQLGARALALLKHLPTYREILTARYKIWKGWTLGWPITNIILTSTEEMWASIQDEEPDEAQQTLLMSRRLFEKHNEPIEIHSNTTLAEFASAFAGRWETIGLLFTSIGLSVEYLPNGHFMNMDEYHDKIYEPEKIPLVSTAIGDLCLQFCDSSGIVNDMQCWLLLHHISLLTIVYGDGDYRPWRKLGDLATTTFALGLHQESENCPFFLREMRKRSMVASYAIDKALATFLGRPPLISGRYCDLGMPLDLSCEQMVAEPAEREAAIARLDSAGWNQDGSLERGACGRVTLIGAIIREKVLELSLCPQTQDLRERVEELSQDIHKQYQELPAFLRWDPNAQTACSNWDDRLLVDLHLEYLYNDFLLYRILMKRTNIQPERIISLSLEIMNALLSMVDRTFEYPTMRANIAWLVCHAGLPSAGVLSADLLRQSRLRTPEAPTRSRSEVIQKLSIFASHLGALVRSEEGNYQIAQQGQRAIRCVLDQVLSAPNALAFPPAADPIGFDIDDSALISADLLDGIDIDERGPFLEWLDGTMDAQEQPWLTWMSLS